MSRCNTINNTNGAGISLVGYLAAFGDGPGKPTNVVIKDNILTNIAKKQTVNTNPEVQPYSPSIYLDNAGDNILIEGNDIRTSRLAIVAGSEPRSVPKHIKTSSSGETPL